MSLTTLPPPFRWIGKREIGDNRACAFSEQPEFHNSFKYKGLFSRTER